LARVRIVTDSSAHFLDPAFVDQHRIEVMPLKIQIGNKVYREGVDLDADNFYRQVNASGELATLLPPSMDDFAALYSRLNRETDQILSLHISRQMGITWDLARAATKTLLGRCEIGVVDSMTTSVGLAMLVEAAALMADQGASLDEIVREVRALVPRVYTVFYVDSLDYLRHNGLLSEAQSILGAMLNIKPFLTIEEGEIIPMEKVRTQVQAVDKLVEFVTEFSDVEQLVILHGTPYPTDDSRLLLDRLAVEFPGQVFPSVTYRPSLATMIGLNGMGVVVFEGLDDEDDL
jgi:DegV family protein with EDD domain